MKLDDHRLGSQKNDHSLDPQFLTFRHHAPSPPAHRAINSQRHDYKSLQKYPLHDFAVNKQEEMHEVEAECGKKKDYRPLRQARSQEKGGGMMKKEFSENFDRKKVVDEEESPNLTWTLKQKIKSIMRAIKKEEELEGELEEGINLMKREIEEKGWEIKEQSETIEELREIREENMGECSRLLESIEEKQTRNRQLEDYLRSVEGYLAEVNWQRALPLKLKEGLTTLNQMKYDMETSINKIQAQIDAISQYHHEVETYDEYFFPKS